jgi:hypothetical protein
MTTLVSPTTYTFQYDILLNTMPTLIILFVPAYGGGNTPDSTLDGEGQSMPAYDDLSFYYLRSVSCTRTQEELGGSQLPGAPATGTQEGGAQSSSGWWLEVAVRGVGSSHLVGGSDDDTAYQ